MAVAVVLAAGVLLLAASALCLCRLAERQGFPGKDWARISPEDAGFDRHGLRAFAHYVGGHGCIVRGGRLVHAWGRYTNRFDVSSAVKPVYMHLLSRAIEDGLIESLDTPVAAYEPALSNLNEDLDWKDRRITWRHLATQTSCYGVREEPGTAFNYCDRQTALLIDTLIHKVYDAGFWNADEVLLGPALSIPLQCQDDPTMDEWGRSPARLRISARDFARLGLLYLSGGQWKGTRLLPRAVVAATVSSPLPSSLPCSRRDRVERLPLQRSISINSDWDERIPHLNSYSYTWWVNGITENQERLMPDVPEDVFMAVGHGGQDVLMVFPSLNMVVCWLDAFSLHPSGWFHDVGHWRVNGAIRRLLKTMHVSAGA